MNTQTIPSTTTLLSLLLVLTLGFLSPIQAQEIPEEYVFWKELRIPEDLKHGVPASLLFDSTRKYMLIEYDYKPTYLELYRMEDMKRLKRLKVKGHVYLDNSYFYPKENALYLDFGRARSKYVRFDLSSYEEEKVPCEEAPWGCHYDRPVDIREWINPNYYSIIQYTDWYVLKSFEHHIHIYLCDSWLREEE